VHIVVNSLASSEAIRNENVTFEELIRSSPIAQKALSQQQRCQQLVTGTRQAVDTWESPEVVLLTCAKCISATRVTDVST
jgi:hypothetical protein